MPGDRDAIEQVKQRLDIVQVVGEYLSLRRAGRDYVGLCPFHDEKTPSLHVSQEKQVFHCFGCHAGGDVIRFVEMKEGIGFREALEQLAGRAGVELPERRPGERMERSRREALLEVLAAAGTFYRRQLAAPVGDGAKAYLKGRGVSGRAAQRFGLGWAPDGWDALVQALRAKGVDAELMVSAGLAQKSKRGTLIDRFRARVMFPIWDERGRVTAFGGRLLAGDGPKYLNSPETPVFQKRETWYGLHLARERMRAAGRAIVVEGYMDCLAAHERGFTETVASLGTALSEQQAAKLARFTKEARVAYDADTAGQSATLRGFDILRAAGVHVRLAMLPAGRDPDEILRGTEPQAFARAVDEALPLVEYLFQLATQNLDLASVEGKVAAVRRLAPALAGEHDAVARDQYVQRYADRLGVEADAVREAVEVQRKALRQADSRPPRGGAGEPLKPPAMEHNSSGGRNNTRSLGKNQGASGLERRISMTERAVHRAEEWILSLVLRGYANASWVSGGGDIWQEVPPEQFSEGVRRRLAEALFAATQRESDWRPNSMPPSLDADTQALAARLLVERPIDEKENRRILQDCLRLMANQRVRAQIHEHQREMRMLERSGQPVTREMRQQLAALFKELKALGSNAGRAVP